MKLASLLTALAALHAQVSGLQAPIEGYGVVIPEWEVEVSPGGPVVVLNGTVEEVHDELLRLNPAWDEDYLTNTTTEDLALTERATGFTLAERTDFTGASYFCRGKWPECDDIPINSGVQYLRGVKGQPRNGPGPGNCGRVSCSYKAAIWWCNDDANPKTLNAFGSIADGAEFLLVRCSRLDRYSNGQWKYLVSGQVFHDSNWNVIVRYDDQNC